MYQTECKEIPVVPWVVQDSLPPMVFEIKKKKTDKHPDPVTHTKSYPLVVKPSIFDINCIEPTGKFTDN